MLKDLKLSELKSICNDRANCIGCIAEDFCAEYLADDVTPGEFEFADEPKGKENT